MKSNTNVLNFLLGNLNSEIHMVLLILVAFAVYNAALEMCPDNEELISFNENIQSGFRIIYLFSFDILFILGIILFNMDKSQRN